MISFISWKGICQNHDLNFTKLADRWDEAIPLGNGMIGALIWQKANHLRFSLDRADLWDQRPMNGLHRKEFSFQWVAEQVQKKDYAIVQKYFDYPYDHEPAPSKIPGGALEFETSSWGAVVATKLLVDQAICQVNWANGTVLKTFVHATKPEGWFRFEHLKSNLDPHLIAPRFQGTIKIAGDPVGGDDLSRLGYPQGSIKQLKNLITYQQQGWGGFSYSISIQWKQIDQTTVEGVWSISSKNTDSTTNSIKTKKSAQQDAQQITGNALHSSFQSNLISHHKWWADFWNRSSIQLPDTLLEKQWYLEQYKFGSAARVGAPPISLQSVWTADNDRLPPWKGDYHHDLNTQLSYWPAYSSNHLDGAMSYLDHLNENKENYQRYTKLYFGKEGLAVPGVTTLDGTEMGGWIQYALSPTVSAWLAQHFYLQWRYSMDRNFLKNSAYPWLKETAVFLERLTYLDENGFRKLPISASPEINDNSLAAWFTKNTNYDLSLMKYCFQTASIMATELGLKKESEHWKQIEKEFDGFAISRNHELQFAPDLPYNQSHRHFSNAMAIHPLGLIKWEDGAAARDIIKNTIHLLDSVGPSAWCGYSYSWLANLKARAKDGEGTANALKIFATAFCSINSFHLNGDQSGKGYSGYKYRPFTLEGNFAFAAGIQEMLLQSHAGFIEIMPAVPTSWKNISFSTLRAEGAFLVSAKKINGQIAVVSIRLEKGGSTRLKIPFEKYKIVSNENVVVSKDEIGYLKLDCKKGATIVFEKG